MKKKVTIVIFIWLIIICSFVLTQEFTLRSGTQVLLKTVPVDPRDLFRGDYVILNYKIAQIPSNLYLPNNKTVYVTLDTDEDNVASAVEYSEKKPSNKLFIKGTAGMCDTTIPLFKSGRCVKFGIESYFVKEFSGKVIEKDLRNGTLVKAVIDKNGNAKVVGFVK